MHIGHLGGWRRRAGNQAQPGGAESSVRDPFDHDGLVFRRSDVPADVSGASSSPACQGWSRRDARRGSRFSSRGRRYSRPAIGQCRPQGLTAAGSVNRGVPRPVEVTPGRGGQVLVRDPRGTVRELPACRQCHSDPLGCVDMTASLVCCACPSAIDCPESMTGSGNPDRIGTLDLTGRSLPIATPTPRVASGRSNHGTPPAMAPDRQ